MPRDTKIGDFANLGDDVLASLAGPRSYPLCIQPLSPSLRLDVNAAANWVAENKQNLEALLVKVGAVLFRGFPVETSSDFDAFLAAFPGHDQGYVGGTSQRGKVTGRVMESTVAPPDRVIPIHQEMAYSLSFPQKLAFFCEVPSPIGGETPICDMRELTAKMPRRLHDNVHSRGLKYWRHFRNADYAIGIEELDIVHRTWQQAFQTDDAGAVERQILLMGSEFEWCETGIIISNSTQGFVVHPRTGEEIWFNSIGGYGFSEQVIGKRLADLYQQHYTTGRPMPFGVRYGDGESIDPKDIEPLYKVTEEIQVTLPWQRGDISLLDNILMGHGRNTFSGERKIRVSLLH
ncbi:MAG: hypothetical protein EOO82_00920 [Oxalobacteraceae bacterium]|nr:MAG: hypothetical protein EOO82_00920 [Oxalobacteraceae bacterium]